jgi:hypothetical protein
VDKRLLLANKPVQVEVHTDPALEVPADCADRYPVSNLVRNAFHTASGTVVIRQMRAARALPIPAGHSAPWIKSSCAISAI